MTRKDILDYLEMCAAFRRDKAERSYPGSWSVIKNEQYAYALERVIEYVAKLPDDDVALQGLSGVDRDLVFDSDEELHAHTIHCSLGKPDNIPEWFGEWTDRVIGLEGGEQ